MHRARSVRVAFALVVGIFGSQLTGCGSDVGEDTPVTGVGGAMPMDGSTADAHAEAARDAPTDAVADAKADAAVTPEATVDAVGSDVGPVVEASAPDARADAAPDNAAPVEASAPDAVVEAGPPDTGTVVEAGPPDTGAAVDAGPDKSIVEAGPPDVSVTDATGNDASDAAPATEEPDVCPAATCGTANCGTVTNDCGNSTDCGTCTAPDLCGGGGTPNVCGHVATDPCDPITGNTIACLTSKDHSPGSCYQCAADLGCFDPSFQGKACEDLATQASATCQAVLGVASVPSEKSVCLATLGQLFSSHCAAGMQVNPCLCGTTAPDQCLNGTATPTGPLFPIYQCDLGPAISSINQNILSPTLGAGVADAILQCAQAFSCDCAY